MDLKTACITSKENVSLRKQALNGQMTSLTSLTSFLLYRFLTLVMHPKAKKQPQRGRGRKDRDVNS